MEDGGAKRAQVFLHHSAPPQPATTTLTSPCGTLPTPLWSCQTQLIQALLQPAHQPKTVLKNSLLNNKYVLVPWDLFCSQKLQQ